MYGDCLDPVAKAGELHCYDPLTPAKDGDIVLVQWTLPVLEAIYARNASNADWIALSVDPKNVDAVSDPRRLMRKLRS